MRGPVGWLLPVVVGLWTWSAMAANPDALGQRGANGQSFSADCPPNFPLGSVWGTDPYTDDSDICTAAAHAGIITQAAGGRVTYVIAPGEQSYSASQQHGITSGSWGPWPGSFTFRGGGGTGGGTSACGLGAWWEVVDTSGAWMGTWTRRGDSNTFDAHWTRAGEPDHTATLTIDMTGSAVTVHRQDTVPNKWLVTDATYQGTVGADGLTVSGTVTANSGVGPLGPFDWAATIHCEGAPPGHPGGGDTGAGGDTGWGGGDTGWGGWDTGGWGW